jgi:hypothetical protein
MVPAMGVTTRVKDAFTGTAPASITSAVITSLTWINPEVARLETPAQNTGQSHVLQT